jgi:hypothetical protein
MPEYFAQFHSPSWSTVPGSCSAARRRATETRTPSRYQLEISPPHGRWETPPAHGHMLPPKVTCANRDLWGMARSWPDDSFERGHGCDAVGSVGTAKRTRARGRRAADRGAPVARRSSLERASDRGLRHGLSAVAAAPAVASGDLRGPRPGPGVSGTADQRVTGSCAAGGGHSPAPSPARVNDDLDGPVLGVGADFHRNRHLAVRRGRDDPALLRGRARRGDAAPVLG